MDMKREEPWVLEALQEWILENGDTLDGRRFLTLWRGVRKGIDPLPCPNCFLEGEMHPLAPMDVEGGVLVEIRPWLCKHCGTRFDVPLKGTTKSNLY